MVSNVVTAARREGRRVLGGVGRRMVRQSAIASKRLPADLALLFDEDYYVARYPDVLQTYRADPVDHFIQHGLAENRRPGPLFDPEFYAEWLPADVKDEIDARRRAGRSASLVMHFLRAGGQAGLNPLPSGFDSTWYIREHPEVAELKMNPLVHWITRGLAEALDPAPEFNTKYYLESNPDVRQAGVNPLSHYIRYGHAEGRSPDPLSPVPWDPQGWGDRRAPGALTDVVFINGVHRRRVPHPPRFRVDHQMEQLESAGLSCQSVYLDDLTLDWLGCGRVFVFYRCPETPLIRRFVERAREQRRCCLFDCDDLIFNATRIKGLASLKDLPEAEREQFEDGVWRYRATLELCDGAIASTDALGAEMARVVPDVFVNRNTASVEMVARSRAAMDARPDGGKPSEVVLGYFSGSMTHNADFDLVAPAIARVMAEDPTVVLKIAGFLDVGEELERYDRRIRHIPFMGWRAMFDEIADIDINLAPLTDSVFNAAKSENKWLEAALVGVPTIASDIGAFHDQIVDGVTGVLAQPGEWYEKLHQLVSEPERRRTIGAAALDDAMRTHTTMATGLPVAQFIRDHMAPAVGFVVWGFGDSGGNRVVREHARVLREHGVTAFALDPQGRTDGDHLMPVVAGGLEPRMSLDLLVSTFWPTLERALRYPNVMGQAYLVQGREDEFYEASDINRGRAAATYCRNDVDYVTVSTWCQGWLKEHFGRHAAYVPNGIDDALFPYAERAWDGRIRILIEGDCKTPWRNVDEAFRIVDLLDRDRYEVWYMAYASIPKPAYRVDRFFRAVPLDAVGEVYGQAHILLKTSILESFSYPPLEMMATGGQVVVRPNGGNVEYLRDGENCLFYSADDLASAVAAIERLVQDSGLRAHLNEGGRRTVESRRWTHVDPRVWTMYESLLDRHRIPARVADGEAGTA